MSTELENLLRRAARGLPQPSKESTSRARQRALAAVGRRRRRRRPVALALVAGLIAAGAVLGALIVPSSGTADEPFGLGFVPAPGWNAVHDGGDGTPTRPTVAIAANVPLSPRDDADALPLSTLRTLPPEGIVMVAIFTARGGESMHDRYFPPRTLPLRVGEGDPYGVASLRPGRPLGQVHLTAAVNRHNVDLTVYFGVERPSAAQLAAAQRQLDRLVVRTKPPDLSGRSWRGVPPFEAPQ